MVKRTDRAGFNVIELIIVIVVLGIIALVVAMRLPRQRELARRSACQQNLMQIGVALLLYDQATRQLPVVPELGTEASQRTSPLEALLEQFSLSDLKGLDLEHPPTAKPNAAGRPRVERRVPGFTCPSDLNGASAAFTAPVSYRAAAGSTPDGKHGLFAPGQSTSVARVEAGDGAGFSAAFSERLIGTNRAAPALANYATVAGPIAQNGCPSLDSATWNGDAGSSWSISDWRSTLYQHGLTPNASPSCISNDGKSGAMGASSGHSGAVNLLTLDGSVKSYTATVDPQIWRKLAEPETAAEDESAAPR